MESEPAARDADPRADDVPLFPLYQAVSAICARALLVWGARVRDAMAGRGRFERAMCQLRLRVRPAAFQPPVGVVPALRAGGDDVFAAALVAGSPVQALAEHVGATLGISPREARALVRLHETHRRRLARYVRKVRVATLGVVGVTVAALGVSASRPPVVALVLVTILGSFATAVWLHCERLRGAVELVGETLLCCANRLEPTGEHRRESGRDYEPGPPKGAPPPV